jgi:hypothetical protein
MNLDIHDAVVMAVILTVLGAIMSIWSGVRAIRTSRQVPYYRLARRQVAGGWWTILFAIVLAGLAFLLSRFAEPVAYTYFPPSPTFSPTPTITLTPTISLTPTITDTPTITLTPAESYTPTNTTTPFVPMAIEVQFASTVTPAPEAVFSPLKFSLAVANRLPVNPQTVFVNPLKRIFVTYSYDGMTDGVQWTELFYRDRELLAYDTDVWDGGTGGYGQYELDLPTEEWLPGTYQLVIFDGKEWHVLGEFRVTGEPPTPTNTPLPSLTPSATATRLPTWTPRPSDTRWPTATK